MFREMRRFKQGLPQEENLEILSSCTSGVLNLLGDDGYTYGVPLSYAYEDGKLYFHCAKTGHKMDAINGHDKVSFTVIAEDNVLPERSATAYKSVIAFGRVFCEYDPDEKRRILRLLMKKYSPERLSDRDHIIEKKLNTVQIVVLKVEHLSGKEAIEFTKARQKMTR